MLIPKGNGLLTFSAPLLFIVPKVIFPQSLLRLKHLSSALQSHTSFSIAKVSPHFFWEGSAETHRVRLRVARVYGHRLSVSPRRLNYVLSSSVLPGPFSVCLWFLVLVVSSVKLELDFTSLELRAA